MKKLLIPGVIVLYAITAYVIFSIASCYPDQPKQMTDIDDMFRDRDSSAPQALKVIPGQWRFWRLSDT